MLVGGLEEYGDEMRPSDRVLLYDPGAEDVDCFRELPKLPVPLGWCCFSIWRIRRSGLCLWGQTH